MLFALYQKLGGYIYIFMCKVIHRRRKQKDVFYLHFNSGNVSLLNFI